MTKYKIDVTLDVEADSKADAADFIKDLFAGIGELDFSNQLDTELFAEMGISYD